jgi:hypothetical protein
LEKLVNRYLRDDLHQNQFAYQAGRSLETALHNIMIWTENAIAYKETALGIFLDRERDHLIEPYFL